VIIKHAGQKEIGTIDLPSDCDGDDLYDIMIERGYIETIDNYNVDGDESGVSVMGKTDADGDFYLEYVGEPKHYHFMTIWKKNQTAMNLASELLNIPVFYGEHPDNDFVTVSTTSTAFAPRLVEKYQRLKPMKLADLIQMLPTDRIIDFVHNRGGKSA
jgi:hypothetical protein